MIPTLIVTTWLLGLLSFAILGGAIYLLREWHQRAWILDPILDRLVFAPDFGFNLLTLLLVGGLLLLTWSFAGRLLLPLFLGHRRTDSKLEPPHYSRQGEAKRLPRPDGAELQVEFYGPEDGLPIVLSHGWGMNSTEWHYLKRELADHFRLIVWDEPGLGLSTQPRNRDYSLEKMARDLEAVLGLAGNRPALLLGHSIGGMITQTFCHLFPDALGTHVRGLVLTHTTYTNPVRTVKWAPLFTALERPVIRPLLHLTIWLWPLVWLLNWMSYLNGTAHLATKHTSFAGNESWDQIEFATRYQLHASPAVVARGMFGMLHYDATAALKRIDVPVLIVPGDQDPLCPLEASVFMHQNIADSQLLPLTPARHLGLLEHHEEYARRVQDFCLACMKIEKTTSRQL